MRHDRIFEKAAGVSQHFRIGQLAAPDSDDRPTDIFQRYAAERFDLLLHVSVAQPELRIAREDELNRQDYGAAFQLPFENAVPVTETAFRVGQRHGFPRVGQQALDAFDRIFRFGPVRSDVLYRRGPDIAWDQRQVFDTAQSVAHRPGDEVVPFDAGSGSDAHRPAVVRNLRDVAARGMQHGAVVIAREQHVVTAAEDHPFLAGRQAVQQGGQFGPVAEFGETPRRNVHPETVQSAEGFVFFHHTRYC